MTFTLSGVTYTYPHGRRPVIRGLNLQIPQGATTALLGVSGAGKSTLLYLLGLLWEGKLDAGTITFHDGKTAHVYESLDNSQRSELRKSRFGFALQSSYLLPHFTCAENIAMPLAMSGWEEDRWRPVVEDLIRRADADLLDRKSAETGLDDGRDDPDDDGGLWDARDKIPSKISGGQRQRVALLRAVVNDPQVVFADEPFSNLDTLNTTLILDLLADWRNGKLPHVREHDAPRTLVLVCHDMKVAYQRADYFIFLGRNRPTADLTGDVATASSRAIARDQFPGGPADLIARLEEISLA